jgi:hypothetical protein
LSFVSSSFTPSYPSLASVLSIFLLSFSYHSSIIHLASFHLLLLHLVSRLAFALSISIPLGVALVFVLITRSRPSTFVQSHSVQSYAISFIAPQSNAVNTTTTLTTPMASSPSHFNMFQPPPDDPSPDFEFHRGPLKRFHEEEAAPLGFTEHRNVSHYHYHHRIPRPQHRHFDPPASNTGRREPLSTASIIFVISHQYIQMI